MKKILLIVTIISCVLSFSSVSASENATGVIIMLEEIYTENGDLVKEVFEMDGSIFYKENSNDYTISMQITDNYVDYAITRSNNYLYGDFGLDVEKTFVYHDSILISENVNKMSYGNVVSFVKNNIRQNEEIIAGELNRYKVVTHNSMVANSVSSSLKSDILDELHSEGYPSAYTNKYLGSLSSNGLNAYLYGNATYSFQEKSLLSQIIGTTYSVVSATLSTLSGSTLFAIFKWTKVGYNVYALADDVIYRKTETFFYGDKFVKINNTYPYRASKTTKWEVHSGNNGLVMNFIRNTEHFDYDDNNRLLETGISVYQ